ncbi:MAG: acyl-[acyl-carrier-protein] thioesterase [Acidimicrobiales bacterium]
MTSIAARAGVEMVGEPAAGRVHRGRRPVRLADAAPDGTLRLEAVARYLQDVASDDVADAGAENDAVWVVRRTTLAVSDATMPRLGEPVDLATWCSGTGAAWAERRSTVSAGGDAVVEAVSLWVCLNPDTLRPQPLLPRFFDIYGEAAGGRTVRSRLHLPPRPDGAGSGRRWQLRRSDLDVMGHVNNTVAWDAVEEETERVAPGEHIQDGTVEYCEAIDEQPAVSVVSRRLAGRLHVWLLTGPGQTAVSAEIRFRGRSGS